MATVSTITLSGFGQGLAVLAAAVQPEDLVLDTLGFVPHRSAFADMFYDDGVGELPAWRYTQREP